MRKNLENSRKSPYLCNIKKETARQKTSINNLNLKAMTTKDFNAKKMLMSTVAAVVFSFVFTTSANANTPENSQKANLEVRVKGSANGDNQQKTENDSNFVTSLLQIFGVRV
jgi:hypothetical protein